jgi:glycosyltransferase involved in cell wall biosynthesis
VKLSIIMPSWQRPQRTRRAIQSVIDQEDRRWELLVVGDHCPVVRDLQHDPIFSQHFQIRFHNMPTHEGKYGTQCLNWGLDVATGDFVSFLGNDDYLLPTYVGNRLDSVVDTRGEVIYHNALIKVGESRDADGKPFTDYHLRLSRPAFGHIGGSELVVDTELARSVKFNSGEYGHDWTFLTELVSTGARVGCWNAADYVVTHLPGNVIEKGID